MSLSDLFLFLLAFTVGFLSGAPILFDFLAFCLQRRDIALDFIICFLLGLDRGSSAMFLFIKVFSFPSRFDVDFLPLIEYGLILSV